jgi:hypothetical protein
MLKKLLKLLKIIEIDVYVYCMNVYKKFDNPKFNYEIKKDVIKNNVIRYSIKRNGFLVHESFLYKKVFLLRLIRGRGPVIGNCFTSEQYRGQSIYPTVLNYIAKDVLLENKVNQLFIIVNKDNIPSINGIEKAGFERNAKIRAKRWLLWYKGKEVIKVNRY